MSAFPAKPAVAIFEPIYGHCGGSASPFEAHQGTLHPAFRYPAEIKWKERESETNRASFRSGRHAFGLRDNASGACAANLRGRNADPRNATLSAAAPATADSVPGWEHSRGRHGMSSSTAASAASVRSAPTRPSGGKRLSAPVGLSSLSLIVRRPGPAVRPAFRRKAATLPVRLLLFLTDAASCGAIG